MEFPYTEVGPGIFRPKIAVTLWGHSQPVFTDGLLDTGADRTVLSEPLARQLGFDLTSLSNQAVVQAATGQKVLCRLSTLVFSLRRDATVLTWEGEVALADQYRGQPLWGFKGFLEFFRAEFNGPKRLVTLTPGDNLPLVSVPV